MSSARNAAVDSNPILLSSQEVDSRCSCLWCVEKRRCSSDGEKRVWFLPNASKQRRMTNTRIKSLICFGRERMSVPNAKPSFCETNTVMRYYKSSSGMRVVSSSPFLSFASRLSTRRSSRLTFSYASAPLPPSTCSCCCAFHILCSITLICFSSSAICPTLASLPAPFASFVSIGFFIGSSDSGFGALLPPNDPVQIGAFYASRPRHTSTGTAGIAGASVAGSSFVCRMMSCTLYPRWRRPRGSLHTLAAASLDDTVWVVVLEVSAGSRSNMETLRRRRVGVCAAAVL